MQDDFQIVGARPRLPQPVRRAPWYRGKPLAALAFLTLLVLGCLLISGTLSGFMQANNIGGSVVYFLLIGCAGFNFLFEAALNLILAPALGQLWHIAAHRFGTAN